MSLEISEKRSIPHDNKKASKYIRTEFEKKLNIVSSKYGPLPLLRLKAMRFVVVVLNMTKYAVLL